MESLEHNGAYISQPISLRSKRFQSSYLRESYEPRDETLATQATNQFALKQAHFLAGEDFHLVVFR